MKAIYFFIFLFISRQTFAQNKSTVDRALETTTGILKLFDKKKDAEISSGEQAVSETKVTFTGKLTVTNSTGKRISFILKRLESLNSAQKTFVLGIDDKESISNLPIGSYTYEAKFEDGTVAKSSEFDISKESPLLDKIIK